MFPHLFEEKEHSSLGVGRGRVLLFLLGRVLGPWCATPAPWTGPVERDRGRKSTEDPLHCYVVPHVQ